MRYKKPLLLVPLCLALAVCLALSGCAGKNLVVGKVNNESITVEYVNLIADYILMQNSWTRADITDAETMKSLNENALENAVMLKIVMNKAKEMKLYPLSAETQKEVDDIVSQSKGSLPSGMTEDQYRQVETEVKAYQLVADELNRGVTVSDDEIKAEYDTEVASQKDSFSKDAAAYEEAMYDGTTVVVYKPEGYRYVKHILIAMPEDISGKIEEAQTNGDTDTVTKLRDQGLPQIKAKADEVLAKVQAGGDFDSLMAEYGEDPGMKEEPASKTGYELGSATSFVEEFKAAALALKTVGDTTGLVASDYGYHIIKWVGNVPSGPISLEDVKEDISAKLLDSKKAAAWNTAYEQWEAAAKVEKYPDKIPVTLPSAAPTGAATTAPAAQ